MNLTCLKAWEHAYLKLEIILGFQFKIWPTGGEKEDKQKERETVNGGKCWKKNTPLKAVAFLGSYKESTPHYATHT